MFHVKKYQLFLSGIFCAVLLTGCDSSSKNEKDSLSGLANHLEDEAPDRTEFRNFEPDESDGTMTPSTENDRIYDESKEFNFVQCGSLTAEYRYEDLYLSLDIPDGWDCEIKTVEDREKEDGLAVCSILFWPEKYVDTVFEFSYLSTSFGMCATGVTIEHFTLPNGIRGTSYMETIQDTIWMTLRLKNSDMEDQLEQAELSKSDGVYCIQASVDISVWDEIEAEFESILDSVCVGLDPH